MGSHIIIRRDADVHLKFIVFFLIITRQISTPMEENRFNLVNSLYVLQKNILWIKLDYYRAVTKGGGNALPEKRT